MNKKMFQLALALLLSNGLRAFADQPPDPFVSVRLHLTTTTVDMKHTFSTSTIDGIIHKRVAQQKMQFAFPSKIVDGYVTASSFGGLVRISSATTASDRAVMGSHWFLQESNLIKIKHPRPALITTEIQDVYIPASMITKIEKRKGQFDGYSGYGEPFYMPAWQATLLSTREPIFACTPSSERQELDWVSYNENVGEAELQHVCDPVTSGGPTLQSLLKKGNVFGVVYPAD